MKTKFQPGTIVTVFICIDGRPIETKCQVIQVDKKTGMLEVVTVKKAEAFFSRVFWAHPKQVEIA